MQLDPELIKVGVDLASSVAKNSVQAIAGKIKGAKASGDKDKLVGNLEEIINELISERNRLVQLVQAYEETLITQKISDADIEYITGNIVPLLENLLEQNAGEDAQKTREALNLFKPILSKELFNIVQLLGFNFKQAIGEPLTLLINSTIKSKVSPTDEASIALKTAESQREVEFYKVMQDEEAFKRYCIATGRQLN
ncbi:hypothetical protein HQN87_01475 [Paenibacillus tritici]|uniref:Uncharacterized protein n=1 Tax=Paenibacillus tritici TaxID=1873425 RepID=A0ABX2DKK6_9BACL|nr:hypothetical protein [Paenibacillus tritici]NQX43986.1 hypothetical protein [Paenibacillus tritici]